MPCGIWAIMKKFIYMCLYGHAVKTCVIKTKRYIHTLNAVACLV